MMTRTGRGNRTDLEGVVENEHDYAVHVMLLGEARCE